MPFPTENLNRKYSLSKHKSAVIGVKSLFKSYRIEKKRLQEKIYRLEIVHFCKAIALPFFVKKLDRRISLLLHKFPVIGVKILNISFYC